MTLTLRCCECSTEIDEAAAHAFRGGFACESCVREHYRNRPREVELELRQRRRAAIPMLNDERKRLEKLAAQKKKRDAKTALIVAELEYLPLHCIEGDADITVSTAYAFGGGVACEKCVRDYYRERPAELKFELQSRRRNAVAWVKFNRKTLEKRAARRAATRR